MNRLQTLTPPAAISGGNFGFGYDALSRRTSLTRPNTVNTTYGYDNLSHLLSVTHAQGSTTLDGASYGLDNAGNRTSKNDLYAGVTTNYGYDNIYELLSAAQGGTTKESYTYDPVGNRLTALGSAAWSYNTSNELTTRPSFSYAYDLNGNTQTNVGSAGTTTYNWDYENRLTSVVLPGSGGTVTFKYDPFGRRIYKSSSSGLSIYAYDGDNLIEETNSSGTAVARYSQGLNIDEPLAMLRSATTSYYQADGLGSLTSLSNTSGALANTYTYDSFGNQIASTGSLTNPFRYTGREFDTETSLYYYRARYYDQTASRFLSEDAARFAGGTTFYEYAGNNPVVFVDWSGNCPVDLKKFTDWLDKYANPSPTEWCTRHIRQGLESGGGNTQGSPVPAKDWGPFLTKNLGFSSLPQDPGYSPQLGDIAVFQPANGSNPNGHIEAWDGTQWVSDYKQGPPLPNGTHFYPNFKKYGPQPYQVYRCN